MFGFEWDEKEAREALLEAGEARGKAKWEAIGEARGEARGEVRGKFTATLGSIKNLMASTKWSAEDAMKALNISPAEYSHYRAFL